MKAQGKGGTGSRSAAKKASGSGRNGGGGINRQADASRTGFYHKGKWPATKKKGK